VHFETPMKLETSLDVFCDHVWDTFDAALFIRISTKLMKYYFSEPILPATTSRQMLSQNVRRAASCMINEINVLCMLVYCLQYFGYPILLGNKHAIAFFSSIEMYYSPITSNVWTLIKSVKRRLMTNLFHNFWVKSRDKYIKLN
jgi:hypothetical protein